MTDESNRPAQGMEPREAVPPSQLPPAAYELLGQSWMLSSPILTTIPGETRPTELTVCATCPSANWFLTVQKLKCYCSAMRILSWGAEEMPIRACDMREMAIDKINQSDEG